MAKFSLWIAVLFLAAAALRADDWQRRPITAPEVAQGFRNDVVLAKPRSTHRATVDAEESAEGAVVRKKFERFSGIRAIAVRNGETPEQAVARLMATGRYEFVEVDHLRHAFATTPNDPLFSQQWGLGNNGTNSPLSGPGVVGADIQAAAAWDIRHDASGIIVATVNTGMRLTHSDLLANLWSNPTAGTDGYLNDQHGIDVTGTTANAGVPNDDNGHGTHVAGIIGAVGNNGLSVSGVAWNVQLMPLKFLDANGEGQGVTQELECFDFAIGHKAKVINASYGSQEFSMSEQSAVGILQQSGVILVCAAGNTTEDNDLSPSYPTSYNLDNIVSVAASDNRDSLVFFSSYGSGNVDLAAPGYNILSLWNTSDTATEVLSGTSMATPMVTGALALLKAQFPSDTYRQTINRLLRHVDQNPNFTGKIATGGRLNLAAALASGPNDNTPFNDAFAARGHLSGYTLTARGSNAGATRENNEPALAGNATGATVWWDWTAPSTGPVNLAVTVGSLNGLVGVYTGNSVDALTNVTTANSNASFTAQAGVTYEFAVDGISGTAGLATLTLSYGNGSLAGATPLSGANVSATDTSVNGSSGAPKISNRSSSHTVWYTWTAPATGHFQISVTSPDFDPLLGVYTGASVTALTALGTGSGSAISDENESPVSGATVGFAATAGVTYDIQVGGTTDFTTELSSGQFTLSIANARWAATSSDAFDCSPAVAPDGTIYIGGDNAVFYAFKPDGTIKWTYSAGGFFDTSSAAIAPDGTVYAGSADGHLYAFTPAGVLKWKFAVNDPTAQEVSCSPAIAADGTIYFKDTDATFYAVNPTGTLKWTAAIPGDSYAAPTVAADGTIYIGSDDDNNGGILYALNPAGGSQWTFNAGQAILTAAAIDSAGNLYFATLDGVVYSLNSTGKQLWKYASNGGLSSALTLDTRGTLYFGSYDHNLYALSAATGAPQWTYPLGAQVRASSPAVDSNGVVYVGCYDGFIYGINPDGTLNRTLATGNFVRSSPAIFGTTLYVGSADCRLYAFDLGASAAGSAWPMYMGGARRQGRAVTDALAIATEPVGSAAVTGSPLTLSVAASGQGPLAFQWQLNGANLPGATNSTFVILNPTTANYGTYTVVVSGPQGTVTSTPSVVGALAAPLITTQPLSQTVNTGGTVNLTVGATGGNLAYQWSFAGTAIGGATNPNLLLTNVAAYQGSGYGLFSVTVSNSLGSASSSPAALTVTTNALLLNLSARANVGPTIASYLVAGFATGGTKNILVRGVGPTLASFGLSGALATPVLTLIDQSGAITFPANSGWANDPALSAAFIQTGAFAFPAGSLDTALLEKSLAPGSYTAQVGGANGTTGIALAEVYDADLTSSAARLVNLSARANVGTGASAVSAGFVISGTTSETILIRGAGPTLTLFGLTGVLSAPSLTLFNPQQTALQTNSGWGNDATLSAIFTKVDAFPFTIGSVDAALVVTLPPGAYTAQLSGVGSTTGVALVEVYEVR